MGNTGTKMKKNVLSEQKLICKMAATILGGEIARGSMVGGHGIESITDGQVSKALDIARKILDDTCTI